ncbi:unnamed protein product [Soboliphyme baturini]|uniref:DUF3194 domain-containing protein n=1 Tax=Soboliphyme baturini TaxID=241478 RepID=A0A183IZX0_9BILA|nr:unnamed protein product [Soboliphyme baturini]
MVDNETLPLVTAGEDIKYLGIHLKPSLRPAYPLKEIEESLCHLERAPAVEGGLYARREQSLRMSDQNLKLDLIVAREDGCRVLIDVTVPFDGGGSLRKAAEEKMRKYGQVANEIGGGNLEA